MPNNTRSQRREERTRRSGSLSALRPRWLRAERLLTKSHSLYQITGRLYTSSAAPQKSKIPPLSCRAIRLFLGTINRHTPPPQIALQVTTSPQKKPRPSTDERGLLSRAQQSLNPISGPEHRQFFSRGTGSEPAPPHWTTKPDSTVSEDSAVHRSPAPAHR